MSSGSGNGGGADVFGAGMALLNQGNVQSAASAQQNMANQGLAYQENVHNQTVQAAQPSFGQMQAINNQYAMSSQLLNSQMGSLQNQLQLYNTASGQANALMTGQNASSLAPLQQQQQLQTNALQNQLRAQLGSGYADSSAGSMAMANMAMQQNYATNQAQQQATGMYLGAASSLAQGINQSYSTAGGLNMAGATAGNQLQQLQVTANAANPVNFNNAISTAGNGNAGAMYLNSALTNYGTDALSQSANSPSSGGSGGSGGGGGMGGLMSLAALA
jgi:hypothetical protein